MPGARSTSGSRALALLVLLAACDKRPDDRAGAERAQHAEAFASVARRYLAMREASAKPGTPPADCPDAAIEKNAKGGRPSLGVTELEVLGRFADPAANPWTGERAHYLALTTPGFAAIVPPPAEAETKRWIDALYKAQTFERDHPYLAVLRADKRVPPRLDGDAFSPGSLEGVLLVFEIGHDQPMCVARVSATSSGELVGTSRQAREAVMWKDWVGNIKTALHDAARSMSKVLVLDLP